LGSFGMSYSFFLTLLHVSLFLFRTSSSFSSPWTPKSTPQVILSEDIILARNHLQQNQTDEAYACLTRAYALNSKEPGLMACFEEFFRAKIRLANGNQDGSDRMGLASLLNDQHRFEESAQDLRLVLEEKGDEPSTKKVGLNMAMRELAQVRLFRALAAICNWDNHAQDSHALVHAVYRCLHENQNNGDNNNFRVPALHPFESLKWSCISLEMATNVASLYAARAMQNVEAQATRSIPSLEAASQKRSTQQISRNQIQPPTKPIKIAYLSPDFTGTHPLAFLMQDVFRFHDPSQFELYIYSLEGNEDTSSEEVVKIRDAAKAFGRWKVFPPGALPREISSFIQENDQPDILIDLCGYAGTSTVAEVMAHRVAPIQISYMGFPASSGAPYLDYMIVDPIVVPPLLPHNEHDNKIRQHYTEKLLYMPHCYFVNSHRHAVQNTKITRMMREKYNLPIDAFVFCCHSRPDKIDPSTFRVWLRALKQIRERENINAVLWLLKSGDQMESNLRQIAREEYQLDEHCLVFADVAPREEHLERLQLANLFLDTPTYNAHTVGCDALFAGVPMLSLLRPLSSYKDEGKAAAENGQLVLTDKLASRVGASLLRAVGLSEMIVPDMQAYQQLMIRCALDPQFYFEITQKLSNNKDECPLFDTERWVRNLEVGLTFVATHDEQQDDVAIVEDFEA